MFVRNNSNNEKYKINWRNTDDFFPFFFPILYFAVFCALLFVLLCCDAFVQSEKDVRGYTSVSYAFVASHAITITIISPP